MKTSDLAIWLRRKLRYCYSLHECELCDRPITLGQYYRDGGYGKRAHDDCVGKKILESKTIPEKS